MSKRIFDLVVAIPLAVLAAPLAIVIAVAIRLESSGPALFRARRVGCGGRLFTMYKFRTMYWRETDVGPPLTARDDNRVTRRGAWLRRHRLDELPQLINVIRGDMSLVGPRPEDPAYVDLYSAVQRRVLTVRPGVTGPAQLAFRDEGMLLTGEDFERVYVEEVLPLKTEVDLAYLDDRSLKGDITILFRTLLSALGPG